MARLLALAYGAICYIIFFATFLYAIGFVGDLVVPKGIDGGTRGPAGIAIIIDLALLSLFAVQHSGMARQGFKRLWTRLIPPAIERSTYVLFASAALILLFWLWRPLRAPIWTVASPIGPDLLWALFFAGWGVVLVSTFLISHFELFGLSQVWAFSRQRGHEPPNFRTPFFYGLVRHPIYLGFIIAFFATPRMTAGHLLFAAVATAWMLVAIQLEERDLVAVFGAQYQAYRARVSMILPLPKARRPAEPPSPAADLGS
ncbi:MAG: methanethiol S-methyltransferase [Caulobacteraceae bacterium]